MSAVVLNGAAIVALVAVHVLCAVLACRLEARVVRNLRFRPRVIRGRSL